MFAAIAVDDTVEGIRVFLCMEWDNDQGVVCVAFQYRVLTRVCSETTHH